MDRWEKDWVKERKCKKRREKRWERQKMSVWCVWSVTVSPSDRSWQRREEVGLCIALSVWEFPQISETSVRSLTRLRHAVALSRSLHSDWLRGGWTEKHSTQSRVQAYGHIGWSEWLQKIKKNSTSSLQAGEKYVAYINSWPCFFRGIVFAKIRQARSCDLAKDSI